MVCKAIFIALIASAFVFPCILAVFTDDFKDFLIDSYGLKAANKLERLDLGPGRLGSFGGKENGSEPIKKQVYCSLTKNIKFEKY